MSRFEEMADLARTLRPVLYVVGLVLLVVVGRVLCIGVLSQLWTP